MWKLMTRRGIGLAVVLFLLLEALVFAQGKFPARPITVIDPWAPGAGSGIHVQSLQPHFEKALKVGMVLVNKPGGGGTIAWNYVANSPPDGYTVVIINPSLLCTRYTVKTGVSYEKFDPLILSITMPSAVVVKADAPWKNFKEFIEYARNAKPPLAYASGGNGSQHQLGIEMLKQRAGINMVHVPYRGGAPAGAATIAGETQVVLAGASNANMLRSGQLRGLATTGTRRSPAFPDLPTIGEFYPGYDLTIWLGLFAPAGVPEPIMSKLRTETHKALAQRDLAEKLNVTGRLEPLILTPSEFSALIHRDYEKYGKLVKDIGIKAQ